MAVEGWRSDLGDTEAAERLLLAPFAADVSLASSVSYAQSSVSFVSLGSMLTGRYPSAIPLCGIRQHRSVTSAPDAWCNTIPEGVPTLPQVAGLYGYRSLLVAPGYPGISAYAELFDEQAGGASWGGRGKGEPRMDWITLERELGPWWQLQDQHPRLLVLGLSDLALCNSGSVLDEMGIEHPVEQRCDGADPERVRAVYGERAGRLGQQLERLLSSLPEHPGRDRWIVLVGTRGISLGECGGGGSMPESFCWTDVLRERTLHVPFAVIGPSAGATRVITEPTELVDVLPTLLGRTHAVLPAGLPGQDLLGDVEQAASAPVAYAELGDMLTLRWDRYFATFRAFNHNASSLDPDLDAALEGPGALRLVTVHDVVDDPMQLHDLAAERPALAEEGLRQIRLRRAGPGALPPDLSPSDVEEWLRLTPAQGYW